MSHANVTILIGYASRYNFGVTANGKNFCTFKLMVVDKIGSNDEKSYYNIVCYGAIAENVERFHEENKHVFVDGRLKLIKNGHNEQVDIVARTITFM